MGRRGSGLTMHSYCSRDEGAVNLGGKGEGGEGVSRVQRYWGHIAEHERLGIAAQRVLQKHRQLGVPTQIMAARHIRLGTFITIEEEDIDGLTTCVQRSIFTASMRNQ